MICTRRMAIAGLLVVLGTLGACASIPENVISKPEIELRDVSVLGLGFKNQTFLLSFDIRNPNPFPLPVSHVSYGVRLDGQRFASGELVREDVFLTTKLAHPAAPPHVNISHLRTWDADKVPDIGQRVRDDMQRTLDDLRVGYVDLLPYGGN